MSLSFVPLVRALDVVLGEERVGGSLVEDREFQDSPSPPLGSRRRCLPAWPPSAHFPFLPPGEEMVKDYTAAIGTSKGGSGSQR